MRSGLVRRGPGRIFMGRGMIDLGVGLVGLSGEGVSFWEWAVG